MKFFPPVVGFIVLTVLLVVSFFIDAGNVGQGGAIDLRNRVTGARLLAHGINPYTYKWTRDDPEEYWDPHNNPHQPVSKTTASPALLVATLPWAAFPYRNGQYLWFFTQWALLLGTGALWWRLCAETRQRLLLAAAVTALTYTAGWRLHAERGQIYVLLLFLFTAWLALSLRPSAERRWMFLAGFAAGVLMALRPTFILLAPTVAWRGRGQLAGMLAGLIVGVGLPLIFSSATWSDYASAMQQNSYLYRNDIDPRPGPQRFPPTVENMPTDLLANYVAIPYAPFSAHALLHSLDLEPFPDWPILLAGLIPFGAWWWAMRNGALPRILLGLAAWMFLVDLFLPAYRNTYNDVLALAFIALGLIVSPRFLPALVPAGLALVAGVAVDLLVPEQTWLIDLPSFLLTLSAVAWLLAPDGTGAALDRTAGAQAKPNMLNFVWLGLIALAVLLGGATGTLQQVGDQSVAGANKAITLAGTLLAVMTLWLGLMRLADKAGLVHRLGLALKPVMLWLFPEVPPDHPAMGSIIMNMAANILGLNNAATPLGLRAMKELESLNPRPGIATNAMCMLLAINTSSVTLIPVTVIAILTAAGGRNWSSIIGTALAATAIAHFCAIATVKILERTPWYRLSPLPQGSHPVATAAGPPGTSRDATLEASAAKADAALPWIPGARWVLAGMAGIFLAMLLNLAWPELTRAVAAFFHLPAVRIPTPPPDETMTRFIFLRPIQAASVLILPWLILLLPAYAALRRVPVYEEFVEGGKESVQVILRILPFIVGMLVAIYMFQAAGGALLLERLLGPFTSRFGFPAALVPLAALRPFSGVGGLAILQAIVTQYGPDSHISLAAATMYGCSETTFYVIAVYFGSVGIRKTRHAIPAGIVADIVGPLASVAICRAVFGPF